LLPQVQKNRFFNYNQAVEGCRLILWGMFKKVVIADSLAGIVDEIFQNYQDHNGVTLIIGAVAFSFQIYGDFSGYSDIALGTAKLFGFELLSNFKYPYFSRDVAEFWRRWHISLSTWLREYLYIPLGGNRRGELRTYANLIIVMLLGGLWHGAAWSFMVWGGAHGVLLALERFLGVNTESAERQHFRISNFIISAFRIFLIFNLVSFLWLLFQLPDFKDAVLYVKELAVWKTKGNSPQIFYAVAVFGLPVIAYHFWGLLRPRYWDPFSANNPRLSARIINAVYAGLLFLIVTNSGNPGAFIYFQF
jgi:D-alanyl-lipoteichoic acid acyltransferase DltB (MBOAT superfamily)